MNIAHSLCALTLLLPALGQEPTDSEAIHQSFEQYCHVGEQLAQTLANVTSKEKAEQHVSQLQAQIKQVYETGQRIKAISKLPPETAKQIQTRFEQRMRQAWGKVLQEIYRLQKHQCYGSLKFSEPFQHLCALLK